MQRTKLRARAFEWSVRLEALESRQMLSFDPTPREQYLLELTNRFRINPARELGLLTTSLGTPARSSDADVDNALRYFNTSGPTLASQWASLSPAQPLAWNEQLYNAAEGHSNAMIAADVQEHQVSGEPALGDRVTNAGYSNWSRAGESIFAFAQGVVHTHAGFLLDWGNTPSGIQDPPGHRENAIDDRYSEVGIRILEPGVRPGKHTGPLVVTQDFGHRYTQTQAYVLGVTFGDSNGDGFYGEGEGLGGVSVIVEGTGGRFQTTTMSAGGWQVNAPPGTYSVTFSGAGFGSAVTYVDVQVGLKNVKVDGIRGVRPPTPVIQVVGNNTVIPSGDTTPTIQDFTGFGLLNRDNQSIERTFVVRNTGTLGLNLSGVTRVVISGANAVDFTLTQDLPTTIAAGSSAVFKVRFDPSVVGVRKAQITIVSNDPATSSYTFAVQGRGVLRAIADVRGNGAVIPSGDTAPSGTDGTAFGAVNLPGGARVQTYIITNTGLANLNVSAAVVAQPGQVSDAAAFTVVLLSSSIIAPGDSAELRVRYVPIRAGVQQATVRVTTNDPNAVNYEFAVRGSGRAIGRIGVFSGGSQIASGSGTPSRANNTDFGNLSAGGVVTRAFAIRNVGLSSLSLTGTPRVVISGAGAAAFTVVLQPGVSTLGVGQNSVFRVRFNGAIGLNDAVVTVFSNDPYARSYSFAITGTGV